MSFGPRDYLRHILTEADYLLGVSAHVTRDEFLRDESLPRAFVRSVEVIGEATKQLPPSITSDQSVVPWRKIARMRDRLIHGYFGVDYELVWDVVTTNVSILRDEVVRLLGEIDAPE